jgi:hypothetical protein
MRSGGTLGKERLIPKKNDGENLAARGRWGGGRGGRREERGISVALSRLVPGCETRCFHMYKILNYVWVDTGCSDVYSEARLLPSDFNAKN